VPGRLRVLVADSDADRMSALDERLREISDAVILGVPPGSTLIDAVAGLAPDVIIVDMAPPDCEVLDDLRQVSADSPRPIVMFVDRDDRALMEAAIAAGVSSYNVVDTAFPDIKPIVMAAVAIFRKHQQLADDLSKARATLLDRETINKAKALLMRQRNIDEPRAYRWLRRRAMNENRRIGGRIAGALGENARMTDHGGNFLPRSFSHRSNLLRRTKIDLLPRNRAAVAKSSGPLPAVFLACSLGTRLADCCFAPASQALAGDRRGAAPTAGRLTTGG